MKNFKSKIICLVLLTSLCWSFAFTGIIFAQDFENISPKQKAEYLALPEQDSKILLELLIQPFTDDTINLRTAGYSSPEERAVLTFLKISIKDDMSNYLFVHAPIEALGQVIKASVEIAQLWATKDVAELIRKIEKATAKKASQTGMDFLLQNEIKISAGATEFKYISQNNEKKSNVFQYIIVFQAIDEKYKRVFIKFYSPSFIDMPKLSGSIGGTEDKYHELTDDLPPFVIEIQGIVEKNPSGAYTRDWDPTINIDFPDKVEDFGMKPLSFWEMRVFDPFEAKINDIKVVFSKLEAGEIALRDLGVFGFARRSPSEVKAGSAQENFSNAYKNANRAVDKVLTDLWTKLGKKFSDFNLFGGAIGVNLRETNGDPSSAKLSVEEKDGILRGVYVEQQRSAQNDNNDQDGGGVEPALAGLPASAKASAGEEVSQEFLRDAQEQLDDIAEMIDILSVRVENVRNARASFAASFAQNLGGDPSSDQYSGQDIELAGQEFGDDNEIVDEFEDEFDMVRTDEDRTDEDQLSEVELPTNEPEAELTGVRPLCEIGAGVAPARDKVVFNEIAWMGSSNSASDEWIELKNISGQEIDLTGWQIIDKQGQIKIVLPSQKSGQARVLTYYWLLERMDDDSVPNIAADVIYTGALNNSNEELYLFDQNCVLQDEVIANPGWTAGDNSSKRTMERKSGLEWQTSASAGGTPRANNSNGYVSFAGGGGGSSSSSSTPAQPPVKSLKILINEVQIEGQTTKDEFIELYNPNDVSVNLAGWSLKKKVSSGNETNLVSSNSFSGVILANGYFLIVPQPDDEGNPQYQGAAISDLYYSGKNYSAAANSTILLYDKNNILIDKLGFGGASDFETASFPKNPETKDLVSDLLDEIGGFSGVREDPFPFLIFHQSLGRKINEQSDYQDSDNNAEDFEIQDPTPKIQNQTFSHSLDVEELFNLCLTEDNCTFVGGHWYNDACNPEPEPEPDVCDLEHLGLCVSQETCEGISLYWYNDICNLEPEQSKVQPPTVGAVVINEIAWMGTGASSNDEWIEFFNNTATAIDIEGWTLESSDGSPSIVFSATTSVTTTISAQGFYLLERSDDNVVLEIAADHIYTGALNNNPNCEIFKLYDSQNNLIDQTFCLDNGDWPAGDNTTKQTMERIDSDAPGTDPGNWANNNIITRNGSNAQRGSINGTPKKENSVSKSSTQILQNLPFDDEITEITLTYHGNPYIILATLTIPEKKTLIIEPGVVLKFRPMPDSQSRSDSIIIDGTLIAQGTQEKNIIFTSIEEPEWWGRIYFSPTSENSILEHCHIKHSGRGWPDSWVMTVNNSSIQIKDSIIEEFDISGLELINSSSVIDNLTVENTRAGTAIKINGGNPTVKKSLFQNKTKAIFIINGGEPLIRDNTFDGIGSTSGPISVLDSYPEFQNNTVLNDYWNGIHISGAIAKNWILKKDLPYIFSNLDITEDAVLTIESGVIIKFQERRELKVNGVLNAQGTAQEPIVFTSIFDDEHGGDTNNDGDATFPTINDWSKIHFSNSQGSILENVKALYGGYCGGSPARGEIYVENSDIEFRNVEIKNSSSGVYLRNSEYQIYDSEFIDCGRSYACFKSENSDGVSNGAISDSIFKDNQIGITIIGKNPVFNNVLIESNNYGIYARDASECVNLDLDNIIFGVGELANTTDIVQPSDFDCAH